MNWKKKLTKAELKHIQETTQRGTLKEFKRNREAQRAIGGPCFLEPCYDCRRIARKLGIEPPPEIKKAEEDAPPQEPTPRQLPIIEFKGKNYFVDSRLNQMRNVDNPHDYLPIPPPPARVTFRADATPYRDRPSEFKELLETVEDQKRRE